MSNHLAIATVTATLGQILQAVASEAVAGADVTTNRPESAEDGTAASINIFLFQVSPNPALRNADLPIRRSNGTVATRPQAALDLDYLISDRSRRRRGRGFDRRA